MEPAGLEFLTPETEAVGEDIPHYCDLLLCRVSGHALEDDPFLAFDSPSGESEAKLDVCLYLSCVERGVEKPELYCSLCEESVEVNSVVPGLVVMLMVNSVVVAVIGGAVPDHFEAVLIEVPVFLHCYQEILIEPFAPAVSTGSDLEAFIYKILTGYHKVHEPFEGSGGVVCSVYVDMDSAAAVGFCSGLSESPYHILEGFDIIIGKLRGYELGCLRASATDRCITLAFPHPAFVIDNVVVIVSVLTACVMAVKNLSDYALCLCSGNVVHLDFNSECLLLDHLVHHVLILLKIRETLDFTGFVLLLLSVY